MNTQDLIRIVWGNLNRMRMRTSLTAIGVAIGTAAVVLLISLGVGLQRNVSGQLRSIGDLTEITVMPGNFGQTVGGFSPSPSQKGKVKPLDEEAVVEFQNLPHVVAATPYVRLAGGALMRLGSAIAPPSIVGVDPSQVERLGFKLGSGSLRLRRNMALAGAQIGERFTDAQSQENLPPIDLQDKSLVITLSKPGAEGRTAARNMRIRIVGVLEETGGEKDFSLYLPLADVEQMNKWASGLRPGAYQEGYQSVLVKVDSSENVSDVQEKIQERGFYVFSLQDALKGINTVFTIIQAILGGIGAIALAVAAFGIANTMIMTIYERTREIGIMKAVGAANRDVMRVFLAESGAIGFIGGVLGVLTGFLAGRGIDFFAIAYVSRGGSQAPAVIVHTPIWLIVSAVIFATAVGLISGIYPASRAAQLDPMDALRYE